MADFESKYSGEQVESLLDMVANGEAGGGGGGGIAVEIDPIFSASPAASITEADKQAWSGKQDAISDLATIRSNASKGATAVQPASLASVATSGSYNDLSNKPTIPSAVTESTVSGWGFTKNTGTYSKPSGGIPKTDLASAVQTSLGKADTALQSYTEQYKGTVTGVKINGTTKSPVNGIVDLGTINGGGGGDAPYTSDYFSLAFFLGVYSDGGRAQTQDTDAVQELRAAILGQKRVFIVSESGDNIPFFAESDGESVWFNFLSLGELYSGQISPGSSSGYEVSVVKGYMSGMVDLDAEKNTYHLLPFVVNRLTMSTSIWYEVNFDNPTGCLNPEWKMQIDCWNSGAAPISFPSSVVWANDNVPTFDIDYIYELSFTQFVDAYGYIYHLGVWSKWPM